MARSKSGLAELVRRAFSENPAWLSKYEGNNKDAAFEIKLGYGSTDEYKQAMAGIDNADTINDKLKAAVATFRSNLKTANLPLIDKAFTPREIIRKAAAFLPNKKAEQYRETLEMFKEAKIGPGHVAYDAVVLQASRESVDLPDTAFLPVLSFILDHIDDMEKAFNAAFEQFPELFDADGYLLNT